MKRVFTLLALTVICVAMSLSTAEAQRHNSRHDSERKESYRGGGNSRPSRSPADRPQQSTRPGRPNNGGNRPGSGFNRPSRPDGNGNHGNRPDGGFNRPSRPDGNGNHGNRPDGGFNRPSRPDGNGSANHRPGKPSNGRPDGPAHKPARPPQHKPAPPVHNRPPQSGLRPGPSHRPGPGFRPGNGPGFNHGHHPVMRPPHRPWHRPVRPPHWRPPHRRPLVPSFFGITLGMAMNATINALVANNMPYYNGANEVFLNNVYQQNYYWPEAMLSYSGGVLSGSRFFFQTSYPDPSRFRGVYANLCASLGTPVSYTGAGTSLSASWLGYGGDYVTLEYMPMANPYGALRYYTILTYGN